MSGQMKDFFYNQPHRISHKWDHYFDVYERHFNKFKDTTPVHILEIGIFTGGSIEMWIDYFGKENCFIYAIDNNPECKILQDLFDNVKVFIGDQEDKDFLTEICKQIPQVDIIVDDGGHVMNQQINTFEVMYNHLKSNGVYLCEDVHTSYWSEYNGGYKRPGTYIEYIKTYIDKLNAYHSRDPACQVDQFTKSTNSIHFYDSIVVIEKHLGERYQPFGLRKGEYGLDGKLPQDNLRNM